MAAVRSVMVRLSRRSRVSAGSSAAAPMGGRVLEIPQVVVRPAARGPPPSLRHAAIGNLERFCTGRECADPKKSPLMKDNAESILHLLGRWSKDSLRNVREVEPEKALCVSTLIVSVISIYYTATGIWSLKRDADAKGYGKWTN